MKKLNEPTKGVNTKPVSTKVSGGREFTGTVASKPVGMTAKVAITRLFRHPFYGKILRRTKNFLCHVEGLELEIGDHVLIKETRPISKNKHFLVIEKINT